jgi:UrcA family protein
MKQTFKIIAASALATGAIIKAVPAMAEPAPAATNVSIVVHTADLDLSSQAGRNAPDHRLVAAAFDVCGTASDADLVGNNVVRACHADVLSKARATSQRLVSRGDGTILVAANR